MSHPPVHLVNRTSHPTAPLLSLLRTAYTLVDSRYPLRGPVYCVVNPSLGWTVCGLCAPSSLRRHFPITAPRPHISFTFPCRRALLAHLTPRFDRHDLGWDVPFPWRLRWLFDQVHYVIRHELAHVHQFRKANTFRDYDRLETRNKAGRRMNHDLRPIEKEADAIAATCSPPASLIRNHLSLLLPLTTPILEANP